MFPCCVRKLCWSLQFLRCCPVKVLDCFVSLLAMSVELARVLRCFPRVAAAVPSGDGARAETEAEAGQEATPRARGARAAQRPAWAA